MIKTKTVSFLFFISILSSAYAQNSAIGQWRVHLPFNKARLLTQSETKIYCGVEDGLFTYNKTDNSLETITKVNGLSDIQLSAINHSSAKDMLLIGYENGNLDIFQDDKVYNIADIKRKSITGSKRINHILFFNNYAYLSCSFGIVVLNLDRKEIKDSYYLTISGSSNAVYDLATDGTNLYAASDSGIFSANINDPNINYFGNWNKLQDILLGTKFDLLALFENKLIASFNLGSNYSAIFYLENGTWKNSLFGAGGLNAMHVFNDNLILAGSSDVQSCKFVNSVLQHSVVFNNASFVNLRDALIDNTNVLWIADEGKGLFKATSNTSYEFFVPDGPHSKLSASMQILNNQLWVGHSATGAKWDNSNPQSPDGFSTFVNNKWATYDKTNLTSQLVNLDTVFDFMSLAIDPRNTNHVFIGSRGAGVLEFEHGKGILNYYNEANSSLQSAQGNPGSCQLGGMAFDKDYNLWMANSTTASPMSELKTDGTWQAYNFPGAFLNPPFLGEFFIDSYGQKWMDQNGVGLLVFDETGTLGQHKYVFFGDTSGLPSSDIRAIVEDKEGQIWVGTSKGVGVFYNPGSALADPPATAQQVLLKQDNSYQYLFATEGVSCIAIDGANRKWFGTENAGVFLMSADGTQQIIHFTAENSPLLSNNILSMAINQKDGEVFIGTGRGIISYKSDAIDGDDKCHDTYVYPNPVYHDYSGPIVIKGVMSNGNIKITDISGTLVYETTSLGGQAIWNGKNFKGEKAHTGVYLVFCSDED
ncbi:MAG: two-component regulator propeller domain-containing protein, partial [Bacteroidota bacterium]